MNTILAALVNGILVSVPVAFAVWIALRVMPRNWLNSATRYAIWCGLLAVTVVLPLSYVRISGPAPRPVRVLPAVATSVQTQDDARVQTFADSGAALSQPRTSLFRLVFPIRISGGPWPSRIVIAWLIAAALMLVRLLVSAVLLERHKSRGSELLSRAAGCFRLVSSDDVSVPLVAGPWRRTIMLPARLLDELGEREIEQIVTHEAAHLARRDDYALLVQRAVQALFVLHPVVAWISVNIDLEREIACDDFVIGATGNSLGYASCLARVVELSGGVRALPIAAAAAEDRSHLARRVDMLLDNTRHTGTRLLKLQLVAAAACIGALAWGAEQTPDVLAFTRPTVASPAIPKETPTTPVLPLLPIIAQGPPAVKAPPPPPSPPPPPPPAPPKFDVVSIKPNPTLPGRVRYEMFAPKPTPTLRGDRYVDRQTTLQYLVMKAWGVWDYQVVNLPEWGQAPNGEHYAVEATVAQGTKPNEDELRLMVQALLADRFRLTLHRETRSLSVYALVPSGSRSKLQPVSGDADSGMTVRQIINRLSIYVSAPIIDKTALTGSYDISAVPQSLWNQIGAEHHADPLTIPETLTSNLRDRLGLKLEPRKESVEVLAIDHAEKPSPN